MLFAEKVVVNGRAFPPSDRYRLCATGKIGCTPKAFYANANDPSVTTLFESDAVGAGDVVEIDTGLAQFFFYCRQTHDWYVAYFNVERIIK